MGNDEWDGGLRVQTTDETAFGNGRFPPRLCENSTGRSAVLNFSPVFEAVDRSAKNL
jgi:hypothetical protein